MLNTPGVQCTPVSIHCEQLRNIRLVPRAQRVSIFIFTHPECWESVISDVPKSVSRERRNSLSFSSWRGAVNLLTRITHSSWTADQSEPSIQVTWPVLANERRGLVHDTPLSPELEIMFSKFSHDIQWFEYSGKWRLLEANLNGQIIGLSNFFHRKLLHSGVLRVNLSNFS